MNLTLSRTSKGHNNYFNFCYLEMKAQRANYLNYVQEGFLFIYLFFFWGGGGGGSELCSNT